MPVYTAQNFRDELRNRTHDDASSPYASDTQIDGFVQSSYIQVGTSVGTEVEDSTTPGTAVTIYTIPAAVDTEAIVEVGFITASMPESYQKFTKYRIFAGKIQLTMALSSTQRLVFRYERPIQTGDTVNVRVFEAIILGACITWSEYAMAHRADFEQWAATNRSDTRISEITELRRVWKSRLTELLASLPSATKVLG